MRCFAVWPLVAVALGACSAVAPEPSANWGSDQAALTVAESGILLRILTSGGCYGSYGEVAGPLPTGPFSRAGRFTQLTGVFPGKVTTPAVFAGTLANQRMTITVTFSGTESLLGPYQLMAGVTQPWPACLFP